MQFFRIQDQQDAGLVGWGVRVLLVTAATDGRLAARLAGFGGQVDVETDLAAALSAVHDDPAGWGLCVMDCDVLGGLDAGLQAHGLMARVADRMQVMLVSSDCQQHQFPEDRHQPIMLRAPLSSVSLRVGFEHALRDRVGWRAA